jgi:hypothetical protein
LSPDIPFHTITIDFILALPQDSAGYNAIMSVSCKFSKRITLVEGKKDWSAEQWGLALLNRLLIGDWGIPCVIISDRDRKFLSDMWSAIFLKLRVKLLFSTAYHPQTDGLSERTNQTVEILLRHLLNLLEIPQQWRQLLPQAQAIVNSSVSATTEKSPHELAYGMKLNTPLDLITGSLGKVQDFTLRIDAAECIALAQMAMKRYYDRNHQPKSFQVGDKVMLRLHRGYSIELPTNPKLSPQFVGPFQVLERVGRLAYRLAIPPHWRIHPVISIAHLEPAAKDPFDRLRSNCPSATNVDGGDPEGFASYEIEKLVNKKVENGVTSYRVRWLGYGPEYDWWYRLEDLDNAMDLVNNYERLHNGDSTAQPVPSSEQATPLAYASS